MIDPKYQWAIQIDITNACVKACSNCTRFVGHYPTWYMTEEQFTQAVVALKDFPTHSPPPVTVKNKVVGIIGGEPLIHPQIGLFFDIIEDTIPRRENRGLWTGLQWQKTKFANQIERIFGYVNNNLHNSPCVHSPVLVSIKSQVPDVEKQKELIDDCWLQRMWSSTVTPKGFFFCEVAGAFDMMFNGPGGLPVEPYCWKRPLKDFQQQIDDNCYGCGVPLQLAGRKDREEIDDVSEDNLERLKLIGSTRQTVLTQGRERSEKPWQYLV